MAIKCSRTSNSLRAWPRGLLAWAKLALLMEGCKQKFCERNEWLNGFICIRRQTSTDLVSDFEIHSRGTWAMKRQAEPVRELQKWPPSNEEKEHSLGLAEISLPSVSTWPECTYLNCTWVFGKWTCTRRFNAISKWYNLFQEILHSILEF